MAKPMPHDFVLEELESMNPLVKQMFGTFGVYVGPEMKIVLATRERENSPQDNGIWVAVQEGAHESLQKEFPNMRSIALFGEGPTGWQVLPSEFEDFEESAFKLCSLILKNDPRIGSIPKRKLRNKKVAASKKTSKKAPSKKVSRKPQKPQRKSSKKASKS